jgi:hypothetical protein
MLMLMLMLAPRPRFQSESTLQDIALVQILHDLDV